MNGQKERLIHATERLLCSRGLARTTTRDIAQAAKVAEGALYHHFSDKAELILAVVLNSVGTFREVLESLPLQVGRNSLQQNLERVLASAFEFHYKIAPMVCSLFADQELLARVRRIMNERCVGPGQTASVLAAYLGAERKLGRVGSGADLETAAELMLAASFNAALLDHFYDVSPSPAKARRRMRDRVRTLLVGLAPGGTSGRVSRSAKKARR
jgi:AcrR family transcriptional regulator